MFHAKHKTDCRLCVFTSISTFIFMYGCVCARACVFPHVSICVCVSVCVHMFLPIENFCYNSVLLVYFYLYNFGNEMKKIKPMFPLFHCFSAFGMFQKY